MTHTHDTLMALAHRYADTFYIRDTAEASMKARDALSAEVLAELARLKSAVQDYRETLNAGGIELPERLCAILASGAAQKENR